MKVSEIINTEDISKIVKFFKDNSVEQPKIDELKKQYEVTEHPVFDEAQRPKRKILNDDGQTDRLEDVNRLGLPFQKRIVNSSVSFLFGNPVKIICPASTENEKGAIESIKKILNKNKINSFNRRIARDLFRSTQVAEIWFRTGEQTDPKHRDYGFETPYRIKVVKFSPWDSDELYPYFDQYGDMTAFCRGYSRKVENKTVKYFAVYTDEEYRLYEQADSGWKQADFAVADIKKIPVVFAQEEQPDWADVQSAIERLEYLLSNFADTNDYHGNPKIFIQGNITGFA
ncbi:MAG TPA: phage portal protein, partial [Emticicia sp.]